MLKWHVRENGTRPTGRRKKWRASEFGLATGGRTDTQDNARKKVENWFKGASPTALEPILEALFGGSDEHAEWRDDLTIAYDALPVPSGRPKGAVPPASAGSDASVPPPPPNFLGRDADVETIVSALLGSDRGAAVIVQGGPGIGKTALTKAVGAHERVVERFGEARWFVALETATTAAALRDAVSRALGADPSRGFPGALAALRARPGLLILDNLETPWEPPAERRLTEETLGALAAVPGAALVASFRGLDKIGGAAWALEHRVERLDPPFDRELFLGIAGKAFEADPDLATLVAALGGVPLAIELVAKQAYGRASLAPVRVQWDRIGTALAKDADYAEGRLTSLPHSIELSLASTRMTEPARRLFRLLGQLPAGLCEEDRDALVSDGDAAQRTLIRVGLAYERGDRIDLLPPIRDHVARRHAPEEAEAAAWPAHFLELTRERGADIRTRQGGAAVVRLRPEHANIEAAIAAALTTGRRGDVMPALRGFADFSYLASIPSPSIAALAKACSDAGDSLGEASCTERLGDLALVRCDHAAARAAFEKARPLYAKAGFALGEANCIQSLGDVALSRSDHAVARAAYEEARPLYAEVGSVLGEANCILRLGDVSLRLSDYAAARAAYEEARPLYAKIGDVLGEANCIQSLGDVALRRSDHAAARAAYEEARPLHAHVGSVLGEANCVLGLGRVALARSDHGAARVAYEEAQPLYAQIGNVLGEANCISSFGDLARADGDRDGARIYYEEALALYRRIGDAYSERGGLERIASLDEPPR